MNELEPSVLLTLFGFKDEGTVQACVGKPFKVVAREETVPEGHEGCAGRLDLVVRFVDQALLVVEVKLSDAEESDFEKRKGYRRWLDSQPLPDARKHSRMLVCYAAEPDYYGFQPCTWADLCIGLRNESVRLKNSGSCMKAAMVLSFVASVEENLLGLRSQSRFGGPRVADHLRRFLGAIGNEFE